MKPEGFALRLLDFGLGVFGESLKINLRVETPVTGARARRVEAESPWASGLQRLELLLASRRDLRADFLVEIVQLRSGRFPLP